eukprot:ANDGO_01162.mRNA.1 Catalase-2
MNTHTPLETVEKVITYVGSTSAPAGKAPLHPAHRDARLRMDIDSKGEKAFMTTDTGVRVTQDQYENSLKAGVRGPTLLEDFILRQKIMHNDHERIPERVVHARGSAAHGFFEVYDDSMKAFTAAKFLTDPSRQTPVFTRFSPVFSHRGSADTNRATIGFATKFYTDEGIQDFVFNNQPVVSFVDASRFPDLVHAGMESADSGAVVELVAPYGGVIRSVGGDGVAAAKTLKTASGVLYDAVYVPGGRGSVDSLLKLREAVRFLDDMYVHGKPICASNEGVDLLAISRCGRFAKLADAHLLVDKGVVTTRNVMKDRSEFLDACVAAGKQIRFWDVRKDDVAIP